MRIRRKHGSALRSVAVIFAFMGTLFVICGAVVLKEYFDFKSKAVETTGVITEIEGYNYRSDGKNKTGRRVWVRYYVDDVEVNSTLSEYSSTMIEGKELTLYYDPDNPEDVRCGLVIITPVIFLSIGSLFLILGIVLLCVNVVSKKRRRELIENGDKMTGVITAVNKNMKVRINGRHPYKAECEVVDYNGEKYLYSSGNITDNISMLVGRDVPVYVDRQDKSKYFVDVYDALEKFYEENKINDFR